jgi:hypothetical protein
MVPVEPMDVLEKGTPCRLALAPPHAILHVSLFVQEAIQDEIQVHVHHTTCVSTKCATEFGVLRLRLMNEYVEQLRVDSYCSFEAGE